MGATESVEDTVEILRVPFTHPSRILAAESAIQVVTSLCYTADELDQLVEPSERHLFISAEQIVDRVRITRNPSVDNIRRFTWKELRNLLQLLLEYKMTGAGSSLSVAARFPERDAAARKNAKETLEFVMGHVAKGTSEYA